MTVTPPAFADIDAVAAGWRPLTEDEKVRAATLLAAAGRWIRRQWDDLGREFTDTDPDAFLASVEVVREALVVQNARLAAEKYAGFSQVTKTLGPRSVGGTISSGGAAFTWAPWILDILGLTAESSTPRAAMPQATFGDGDFREAW